MSKDNICATAVTNLSALKPSRGILNLANTAEVELSGSNLPAAVLEHSDTAFFY